MKVTFRERALQELYETGTTKDKRYKEICRQQKLKEGYRRAVRLMVGVASTEELRAYSFLHYEKLKYQRPEQRSSVRIVNGKIERLIFTEDKEGITIELIEIDSTHYGNR